MIRILALVVFYSASKCLFAQDIQHSIYLIGDGGKDTAAGPALQMLATELSQDSTATVLFLGDNVYPAGLAGKSGTRKSRISELKLLSQLETTMDHNGYVFWIPGNHDWKSGKWKGYQLVKKQEEFVETFYKTNSSIKNDSGKVFFPKGGLPGPSLMQVPEHGYNLVFLDIQWWLQSQFFHKVPTENGLSKRQMERLFLQRLDSMLARTASTEAITLVAAHHPMYSNGKHGVPKQPWRFILNWVPPFQILGVAGLNRALVQDVYQPRYKRIQKKIVEVLSKYKGVVYVSGHDHNHQYIHRNGVNYIITGSGSKRSGLKGDRNQAIFMDDRSFGFLRLDMLSDGSIRCNAFGHLTDGIFHSFKLR